MALIENLVTKIRAAIYGKDVRESIAAAIEAINQESEEAVESSNASAESAAQSAASASAASSEANAAKTAASIAAEAAAAAAEVANGAAQAAAGAENVNISAEKTLAGADITVTDRTGTAKTVHIDALGGINDLEKAVGDLAQQVTATQQDVDTLVGTDTGKSTRTIANEELAKQLIPEDAQESMDTLSEIASWIQAHPDDAASMNASISALQAILGGIGGDGEKPTVVSYVADRVAALGEAVETINTSVTQQSQNKLDKSQIVISETEPEAAEGRIWIKI